MKTTIWKFRIDITDLQRVKMPTGSRILCAQMQGDDLCLWAIVDPNLPTENREIEIVGTGNPMENSEHLKYISTVQMAHSALVWHVFEKL